jgi:hypothetical protein
MPSLKHQCGKTLTRIRDVHGKFRGMLCSNCNVLVNSIEGSKITGGKR